MLVSFGTWVVMSSFGMAVDVISKLCVVVTTTNRTLTFMTSDISYVASAVEKIILDSVLGRGGCVANYTLLCFL